MLVRGRQTPSRRFTRSERILAVVVMFNAFARREAVEKLRKSLAEHETLRQEVGQASVRLFEQRQRAVAKVVEPVEDYVNRLARSPKEFDRSVREYRIEIDRFKSTVRRIETEAKRSEAIGGGAGMAGAMAGGGGGDGCIRSDSGHGGGDDFRHGVDGNRHLCAVRRCCRQRGPRLAGRRGPCGGRRWHGGRKRVVYQSAS